MADATLSVLELSGGGLRPPCSPQTTSYDVSVANSVSQTTVTTSPTSAGSSISYLRADNIALTDAIPIAAGDRHD